MPKVRVDHAGRWSFEDLDFEGQPPLRRQEGTISFDAGDGRGVAEQYGGRTPSEEMAHLFENEEAEYVKLLEERGFPLDRRDYPSATTEDEKHKVLDKIYNGDIKLWDGKKVNPAVSKGFPGASKLHVGSMPGADSVVYDDVVFQCLEQDISFGIVFENNWLGVWFRVWRKLQQHAHADGKDFLVLTKPDGSVGFNQSIELSYLTQEGIPFRHMRAVDFLHHTAPFVTAFVHDWRLVQGLLEHEHVAALLGQRDFTGRQSLHLCTLSEQWDVSVLQRLVDLQADVEAKTFMGATPLHVACQFKNVKAARALLQAGAPVDVPNNMEVTPLSRACVVGYVEIVHLLLEARAAADTAWPLYCACKEGHLEVSRALLAARAAVDRSPEDRVSPLCAACNGGFGEIARLLLDVKAEVDLTSRSHTPLMLGALKGHAEIVQILVEHKADTAKKDASGKTALEVFSIVRRAAAVS